VGDISVSRPHRLDDGVVAHRLGQTTLLLQPMIAILFEFTDSVGRKGLARDTALGQLPGDGLGTIFAKLEWLVCRGAGHAQPGQSKPSGWFIDNSALEPLSSTLCSRSALAVACTAPQPPAGAS
jgi:hypothetical protein